MDKMSVYNWRWFSAISFISQFLRVPLLLSVANHAESLTLYFLVTLASIPFQFLALEVLQYRKNNQSYETHEIGIVAIVLSFTIIHIFLVHGAEALWWYLVFGISLLMYGAGIGRLRSQYGAHQVLFVEAVSGATGTIIIALAAKFVPEVFLSRAVLLILAMANAVIFLIAKKQGIQNSNDPIETSGGKHGIMPLTGILISTQLERLVIGAVAPAFLTVISLAAGLVQAWRKVGMDDAVVFESLSGTPNQRLDEAMFFQQKRGFAVFLPAALLSIVGFYLAPYVQPRLAKLGILKSLPITTFQAAPMLMALYMASLPAGIVMINMLRDGRARPNMAGSGFLIGIIVVETALLVFSGASIFSAVSPWMVVGLTASLNLVLYRSLMKSESWGPRAAYWFGVVIYLMVVLWTILYSSF
ncbi:hypothetical protein ACI48D_03990 [Massilia sp. LXY-6]|uniref:hypothetical protein n=1 Tax=Massilia sp. LXY-6 TaxID=3379823 RepID=UPI003EE0ED7C